MFSILLEIKSNEYEGKYEWYKKIKPFLIVDKTGNILLNQLQ